MGAEVNSKSAGVAGARGSRILTPFQDWQTTCDSRGRERLVAI